MYSLPTPSHLRHIAPDKYIFYTHPTSPWTHRVHITLNYLNVLYEAVEVDLTKPREEWFLEINPLGQVPALSLPASPSSQTQDRATLAESAIIVTYLAHSFPKPTFFPIQAKPDGALVCAQMSLFIEYFMGPKIRQKATAALHAFADPGKQDVLLSEFVEGVGLLEGQLGRSEGGGGFYGGFEEITIVEAMLAPLLLRLKSMIKQGIYPSSFGDRLQERRPRFWAWMQAVCGDSAIREGWDEERVHRYLMVGIEKKKRELEASRSD